MCSVTWVMESDRFAFFFNRDELKTRAVASSPSVRVIDGARCVAPADPDGNGTWIGVNTGGFACCLLNNYSETREAADNGPRISRGLLVDSILGCGSQHEAFAAVRSRSLEEYRPFHLLLFQPGTAPLACDWDGASLRTARRPLRSFLSSSGFDAPGVVRERTRMYEALQPEKKQLEAFHASHSPRGGAYSVCMHRPDAGTVSFSGVHVLPEFVEFSYAAGPPCRSLELPRCIVRVNR